MASVVLAKGFGMSKWRSKGRPDTPKHFSGPGNTPLLSPQAGVGLGRFPTASASSWVRFPSCLHITKLQEPAAHNSSQEAQQNKSSQASFQPLLLKSASERRL